MLKILTLFYKNYNYGGILQAFALHRFLTLENFQCEHIAFLPSVKPRTMFDKIKSFNVQNTVRKSKTVVAVIMTRLISDKLKKRRNAFLAFMGKIPHSPVYNSQTISGSVIEGDIIIAGSDQIWNPDWTEDAYFLNFVPDHNGKIAYAASIGKSEVPSEILIKMAKYINRFDFVSVREEFAKELLQPSIQNEIKVALDPTLLLSREEWDKIAVVSTIPEPYVFAYLLGNNRNHRIMIQKIARQLNLKIVFLPHIHFRYNISDRNFGDYNLYEVGPAEFVGLIKNAEMVITDSFHGCVFSIIYEKNFWTLKRHKDTESANMNSRLYTLFSALDLPDRLLNEEDFVRDKAFFKSPIDYKNTASILLSLRQESAGFLLNAIQTVYKRMGI